MDLDTVLEMLRAAGEQTRLRILLLLRHGELTVSELVQILGQSQPRVSRHLKLLASSGLVEWVREGSWVFYRLARDEAGSALVAWISQNGEAASDQARRDEVRLEQVRAERRAQADAYFQENAAQWDQIRALQGSDAAVEAAVLAAAQLGDEPVKLLDVGTGTGRMLEVFAPSISEGVGVDSSMSMLKVARGRLTRADLSHCTVESGDMYGLDIEDGSYDVVILHQVLHFADSPKAVIAESARVVKEGGCLVIADYAPHTHEVLRDKHAHRRLGFSKQDIIRWCAAADLSADHYERVSGPELEIDVWAARPHQAAAAQPIQSTEESHVPIH
ncbi:MAG: metalloregulator ArsR/SmtB family transcription factor [Pseudomonadota bacterium]